MRRVAVVVLGMSSCVPHHAPGGGGGRPGTCGHAIPLAGELTAKFTAQADYTPQDESGVVHHTRELFQERLATDLVGAPFSFVEAQGTAPQVAFNLIVINDGLDNYRISGFVSKCATPQCGRSDDWGLMYLQKYTYTDPEKMVLDYADQVAELMKNGCKGDFATMNE